MTPHRSRYAACLAAACLATVVSLALGPGPVSSAAPATGRTVISVTFGDARGALGAVRVGGSAAADVTTSVLTRNRGKAWAVPAWDGSAMQLPAYRPLHFDAAPGAPGTPLAVLRIAPRPTSGRDPLDPGVGAFAWGADFSLDNDTGHDLPDGDNVFQRGLTPDTIWKLQADGHRVTCGLRTVSMTETLYTPGVVIPAHQDESSPQTRTWYRATCSRVRSANGRAWKLQASVFVRRASGRWQPLGSPRTAVGSAGGDVAMDPTIPLSVGGKLAEGGVGINPHPDQFNGIIDNVRLSFG